jgi:hypothetical protein
MGPLILFCVVAGAAFITAIASLTRDSHMQKRADRFAKVYNRAARAQWERFRATHQEVDCAPPIARSGFVVRTMLDEAAGHTGLPLWARSWGKDTETALLAKFDDNEAYAARELRNAKSREAAKVHLCKGVRFSVTFVAA